MGVTISRIKNIELIQNKDKVIFFVLLEITKKNLFLKKARALDLILISESAIIDETSYIEEGTYIGDLAFVGPQVKIGKDYANTNILLNMKH